jgi:hypothetical protein
MRAAHRAMRFSRSTTVILVLALLSPASPLWAEVAWYKGNTHTHTNWSTDGDSSPEVVTDWYKSHGYNFLVITDHNALNTAGVAALGATYNVPGQFLVMPGEEINYGSSTVHVNGVNLAAQITATAGTNVADMINKHVAQVTAQAASYGVPMLSTINHPGWKNFDLSPEDVAQAAGTQFVEVLNCYPTRQHFAGDATHPGMEKLWDIASTIRMVNMGMSPMYGLASDDSHVYTNFGYDYANPGRGYVVVRSEELSGNAIVNAMNDGDFYFSTGVELGTLDFNKNTGVLTVAVKNPKNAYYSIDFIGTPKGTDPAKQPNGSYSADIGKVLATVPGATSASYTFTGDELYVRALIRSNMPMSNPCQSIGVEQAWTQPMTLPEPSVFVMLCGMAIVWVVWRLKKGDKSIFR